MAHSSARHRGTQGSEIGKEKLSSVQGLFSSIDLSQYSRTLRTIRIDQLTHAPLAQVRPISTSHVQALVKDIEKEGWKESCGLISVTENRTLVPCAPHQRDDKWFESLSIPGDWSPATVSAPPIGATTLQPPLRNALPAYVVCDGDHRMEALQLLFDRACRDDDTAGRQRYGFVRVMEWRRCDGRMMKPFEMLQVGASCNAAVEVSKKMDFRDTMFLCMAVAQRIEEELRENKTMEWNQSLGDSVLAWLLAESGALGAVNARSAEKYARLANLIRHDNYFREEFGRLWDVDVKRKKQVLNINLFRLSTFKSFPYGSRQFVLRALVEMALHHPNPHRIRLDKDDSTFFEVAHGLVDIVLSAHSEKWLVDEPGAYGTAMAEGGASFDLVWNTLVPVGSERSSEEKVTVADAFLQAMARFDVRLKNLPKVEGKKAAMDNFRSILQPAKLQIGKSVLEEKPKGRKIVTRSAQSSAARSSVAEVQPQRAQVSKRHPQNQTRTTRSPQPAEKRQQSSSTTPKQTFGTTVVPSCAEHKNSINPIDDAPDGGVNEQEAKGSGRVVLLDEIKNRATRIDDVSCRQERTEEEVRVQQSRSADTSVATVDENVAIREGEITPVLAQQAYLIQKTTAHSICQSGKHDPPRQQLAETRKRQGADLDQNSGSAEHERSRKRVCQMSYRIKFSLDDSPITIQPPGTVTSRVSFGTFINELKTKGACEEGSIEENTVQAIEDMAFTDGVMCVPTTMSGTRLGDLIVPCHITPWLCALGVPIGHWSHAVCSELDLCMTHWSVFAAYFLKAIHVLSGLRLRLRRFNLGWEDVSDTGKLKWIESRTRDDWFEVLQKASCLMFEWVMDRSMTFQLEGYVLLEGLIADPAPSEMKAAQTGQYDEVQAAWMGLVPDQALGMKRLDCSAVVALTQYLNLKLEASQTNHEGSGAYWRRQSFSFDNHCSTVGKQATDVAAKSLPVEWYELQASRLCSALDEDEAAREIWVRAMIELRVAHAICLLGLGEKFQAKPVIPNNGCAFEAPAPDGSRQPPYSEKGGHYGSSVVMYSAYFTGPDAVYMFLWPSLHRSIPKGKDTDVACDGVVSAEPKKVLLERFSVLLVHGNTCRAMGGWNDYSDEERRLWLNNAPILGRLPIFLRSHDGPGAVDGNKRVNDLLSGELSRTLRVWKN